MISDLVKFCIKYYTKKKFYHSCRVASYAVEMTTDKKMRKSVWMVAMAHDLLEDTDCPQDELNKIIGDYLFSSVLLLTKDTDAKYEDYIISIYQSDDEIAKIVKRADIKDHLELTDTLTDKLKEKYYPIIKYIL